MSSVARDDTEMHPEPRPLECVLLSHSLIVVCGIAIKGSLGPHTGGYKEGQAAPVPMGLACSRQRHTHPTIRPCDKNDGEQRRGRTSGDWRTRGGFREEMVLNYTS